MVKFRLFFLLTTGICLIKLVESATTPAKKAVDEEEEDEDEEEDVEVSSTKKPAVLVTTVSVKTITQTSPPTVSITPSLSLAVSENVDLNKALDNVSQIVDAIVKEGSTDTNFDEVKAQSDSDDEDVMAAKLMKYVQELTKIFVETNEISDTSLDVPDNTKLLNTIQEIIKVISDGKTESDVDILIRSIDEILKIYEEHSSVNKVVGASVTPGPGMIVKPAAIPEKVSATTSTPAKPITPGGVKSSSATVTVPTSKSNVVTKKVAEDEEEEEEEEKK